MRKIIWILIILANAGGCDIFIGDVGQEGGKCFGTYRCNEGLLCYFNECISPLSAGESCDDELENPCKDNLFCVSGVCDNKHSLGGTCEKNDDCNAPWECINKLCAPVGGLDEPCISKPESSLPSCNENLHCFNNTCIPVGDGRIPCETKTTASKESSDNLKAKTCASQFNCINDLCVPAGASGQPCMFSDNTHEYEICNDGLRCIDDLCTPAGANGEPCIYSNDTHEYEICNDGLHCIHDLCIPAGANGEPCIYSNDTHKYEICNDGLICVTGSCYIKKDPTVIQPNSNKEWLRCPIGMTWNGWECTGTAIEYHWLEFGDDIDLNTLCPDNFHLPTIFDFAELLNDCDSMETEFVIAYCSSCSEDTLCGEMFTDTATDSQWHWNIKTAIYFATPQSTERPVLFEFEYSSTKTIIEPVPNIYVTDALVLCVRYP